MGLVLVGEREEVVVGVGKKERDMWRRLRGSMLQLVTPYFRLPRLFSLVFVSLLWL